MNNLIKKLSERCWDERLDGRYFDKEEFAELIIKECCAVIEDAANYHEPADTYVDKIQKHFGVQDE
jgi:hypothetical protein